jgi:transcriptional regulator of acetoin/glycerol metabolism
MRELQHVAKFALAVCDTSVIDLACLPSAFGNPVSPAEWKAESATRHLNADNILAALNKEDWNVSLTAKNLGISRATLHRRIVDFDLKRPKDLS